LDEDPCDSIVLFQVNTATDSRSSSITSSDNPCPLQSPFDCLPLTTNKNNKNDPSGKGACFLETPPPSLPDIHLTQDSESPSAEKNGQHPPVALQQLKSKRKQDRPQRKALPREKTIDDAAQRGGGGGGTTTDAGYLSDEYSEPIRSDQMDLEEFAQRLTTTTRSEPSTNPFVVPSADEKIFYDELLSFLSKNNEHYRQIDEYRRETYPDVGVTRLSLISDILKELFSIGHQGELLDLVQFIPAEIHEHLKVCFNHCRQTKKKLPQRVKRVTTQVRQAKTKKSVDPSIPVESQQMLLSPSSPLTEELLSPNTGTIEELTVLPKERDVYEIIHCLCQCQIDNGFMIQVRRRLHSNDMSTERERLVFSVKHVCVGRIANVLE
jgi:hypothetical protein